MCIIQTPFVFKYLSLGQVREMVLPVLDEWVPMKPLADAMEIRWSQQQVVISRSEHSQTVAFPGMMGRPPLCLRSPHIGEWLNSLTLARVKNPDLVRHFQQHFILALEAYLESLKPRQDEADILPLYETEVWDNEKTEQYLSQQPTIHVDQEISGMDKIRADLVAVGVRKADELNYLCRRPCINVYRLNPAKPDGVPLCKPISASQYESGDLLKSLRAGWYPLPEFFRRHPHMYEQKVQVTMKIERDSTGDVVSTTTCALPAAQAPWHTDEFQDEMNKLVDIHAYVKDTKLRQELADKLRLGLEVNEWMWQSDAFNPENIYYDTEDMDVAA